MFIGPISIWAVVQLFHVTLFETVWLFWAETAAFYIFGIYWIVKSLEIRYLTKAEEKALNLQASRRKMGQYCRQALEKLPSRTTPRWMRWAVVPR